MGTARSVLFTVASIIMIAAGTGSLVVSIVIGVTNLSTSTVSPPLILIIAVDTIIFSILNIIAGIGGVRSYNRRTNSAVVIRLPEITIILCLIALILSSFQGIMIWHMLLLAVTGLLVPGLFIFAAVKKSYV